MSAELYAVVLGSILAHNLDHKIKLIFLLLTYIH